jgi:hypothetical protein
MSYNHHYNDQRKEVFIMLSVLIFLIGVIGIICASLLFSALNPPTCQDCFAECREKHQMDIGDSWLNCELECVKEHGEKACISRSNN